MTRTPPTLEQLAAALAHIPAGLDRDDWARLAMAIKSEYPDEDGFAVFDSWSQTDSSGYDPKAVRATWRSVKRTGGVGVGTLLHLAKKHGFALPPERRTTRSARRPRPEPRQAAEPEGGVGAAHEAAAAQAVALWEAAAEVPLSTTAPYLAAKGVRAFGVRVAADGRLLVPLRDEQGKLWNVQRIAPATASSPSTKLFLKGGRKSGLWHWCGTPIGADVVLVCEGYATAASIHEATGRPVAIAFDAGNLLHVSRELRRKYPSARMLVCGDDDRATFAKKGFNPGREKAEAAAREVGGGVAFPQPLSDGASDFNDLHLALGLQAVNGCIERSLSSSFTSEPEPGPRESNDRFDPFLVDDDGVWHRGVDQDGKRKTPEWVCSTLHVEARTRDQDEGGWGYLLSFADPRDRVKQWAMPARMLANDGGEYRSVLLNMGLEIAPSARARNLLTQYILSRRPSAHAVSTDRIGWHTRAFVLPRETIGDRDERVVFQSDAALENTFRVKGTVQVWQQRVAALCAENSRLVFAVACAFAGPLIRPSGTDSGGFHLRGDSSSGKTTALRVAASVYGPPSYMQRWRTTDNALEAIAAQHCDCLLILDELAQVDPKTAGECAYMLANEQSKARATRSGAPRPRLSWRLLFLSAGELGLADHMAEGLKRARTGQEVRMADVPADAGAGMGAFEALHGHEGGARLAEKLSLNAASTYGAVGRAWLEWLTSNAETLRTDVASEAAMIAGHLIPEGAGGQVQRVGARFALVATAGEMATRAGLTGWQSGEATRAIGACFKAWLASRGGIGNAEEFAMLRQVRRFFEEHGEGRFTWWHRAADDHSAKTLQRAGLRRMVTRDGEPIKSNSQHFKEFGDRMPTLVGEGVSQEFFVFPEVFRSEICKGHDYKTVARVLREHGCLKAEEGHLDISTKLPGIGKARCYLILPKIFELDT